MDNFIVLAISDETGDKTYFNGTQFSALQAEAKVYNDRKAARYIQGSMQSRFTALQVEIQTVVQSYSFVESVSRTELV